MKYQTSQKEKEFIKAKIEEFIRTQKPVNFTGTTISPYNLRFALRDDFGFEEAEFDANSMDYWWSFTRKDIGHVTMSFSAESFELILEKDEDE